MWGIAWMIPIIIPARLNSVRLPGKVLMQIGDLPMLEHVRRRCVEAIGSKNVFIASGDEEILNIMRQYGAEVIKSESKHENGTSRVREAAAMLSLENVMIVQGDEPFIAVDNIANFHRSMLENKNSDIFCAVTEISSKIEIDNKDIVKCICGLKNEIIYIFRKSPLIGSSANRIKKIQGLIGFKNNSLYLPVVLAGTVGVTESIEQLILLENGFKLQAVTLKEALPSVNTPQEYKHILDLYTKMGGHF